MSLLERIKTLVFGKDAEPRKDFEGDKGDRRSALDPDQKASHPDVSTSASDPIMDEIAAMGVQPASKPWEIQEAQIPGRAPLRPAD